MSTLSTRRLGTRAWIVVASDDTILSHHHTRKAAQAALALAEAARCEVCKAPRVRRNGVWDHCPQGHTYVGMRSEVSDR